MQSLWNEKDRRDLLARLDKLRSNSKGEWGKMSAAQTVAHLSDWMRMAIGAIRVESKNTPFRVPVIRQIVLYLVPLPRNLPTAPELQKSEPGVWSEDVRELRDLIRRSVEKHGDRNARWPDHPALGKMSDRAWGVLAFRHTDHHLRQFGL